MENDNKPVTSKKSRRNKRNKKNGTFPLSRAAGSRAPFPRFTRTPNGGIILAHSEPFARVGCTSTGHVTQYPLRPDQWPVAANIAKDYTSYRFKKLGFRYKPSTSLTVNGEIVIAPWYDSDPPPPLDRTDMSLIDDIKNIAHAAVFGPGGATELAGNVVKMFVKNLSREIFHTAGRYYAGRANAEKGYREDAWPCWAVMYSYIPAVSGVIAVGDATGELWVDYEIEFMNSGFNKGDGYVSFAVVGTDDTDLGFHLLAQNGTIDGDSAMFSFPSTIAMKAERQGTYFIMMEWKGSSPIPGVWAIVDQFGADVTDTRLGGYWRVATNAVTDRTTLMTVTANTSTTAVTCGTLSLEVGDVVTFPVLSSGSMTGMSCFICECPVSAIMLQP